MGYDYLEMSEDIRRILNDYNLISKFSIGKSIMRRDILCLKIGRGKKKILLSGAYHGLEYLTSAVLMRFLADYACHVTTGSDFFGYKTETFFENVTVYAVPMVNPDGVDIAVNGLDITNPYHRKLISDVGIHSFNRVWQANARGVDINHNFDANWQKVTERKAPSKYGGEYPESEPETKALTDFIRKEKFDMLLAFHSQGGEIYYDFDGMEGERSLETARKMAEESGYAVCSPVGTASFGGCKDWFIKEFGKAGFTIEIGHGQNPLPLSLLDDLYEENAKIILCAINECV